MKPGLICDAQPTARPVSTPASPSGKNTIPKGAPGTVQPDVNDPTPNAPKAGSGELSATVRIDV